MRLFVLSLFLTLLALSFGESLTAQVVNIERLRLDARKFGWSGSVGANVDLTRNQRSVLNLGSNANTQFRRDSNLFLFVAQTGLIKASGQDFANFAFGHLRYTRHLTRTLAAEAFGQIQQNRVNGIQNRFLYGAGLRTLVFDKPAGTGYFGLLLVREREREITDAVPLHRDTRFSAYVAGSYTPESAPWITIANTTYFQPRVTSFSDYRVSTDWNLQVRLRQNLSLVTTLNLVYDAEPPVGLEKATYALKNGLKFTFD